MRPITGTTRVAAVWGHPVSHSRSPAMHNAALTALGLDWVYVPFDVPPECVEAAVAGLRALGIAGVNVTVPLKERIPTLMDTLSDEARRVGVVNTIVNREGVLHGDSTDGPGLLRALADVGHPVRKERVLLLGAGGSARAVAFALAGADCDILIANRTAEKAHTLAEAINAAVPRRAQPIAWGAETEPVTLVVNATSLGMSPRTEEMPALPSSVFAARPFVYDLIYSPTETRLLAAARAAGCETANGLSMLVWQGALALSQWIGRPLEEIPIAAMAAAVGWQRNASGDKSV